MEFQMPTLDLRYGQGRETDEATRAALMADRRQVAELPTLDDVLAVLPRLSAARCMFFSGSIVDGWGHARSDLDLYIISDDPISLGEAFTTYEQRVSTSDPTIHVVLAEIGAYRLDLELWKVSQLDELIGRFRSGVPLQELPHPARNEQDLIARMVKGKSIHGEEWLNQVKQQLDSSSYGLWLAENRKLDAEGSIEDALGMMETGDFKSAVLSTRRALEWVLQALLALHGDYAVDTKWLVRRLARLEPPELSGEQAWRLLAMDGCYDEPESWLHEALAVIGRIHLAVEGRAHD
jgi:hypothetical protein